MQKYVIIALCLFLSTINLSAQNNYVESNYCAIDFNDLEVNFDRSTRISIYSLDAKPFTGCVKQDVKENKIYYLHYVKDGKLERQIGYYYNGQKCRDYHYKDGVAHGTLELFYTDGSPYIYEEYLNGQLHGNLKRWRGNKLVREAKFWYGTKLSEQLDTAALEEELTEEEKRLGGTGC